MPRAPTLAWAGVAALAIAAAAACSDDGHAQDVASFDEVWTTIRDHHFDPTFGGLDWNAVRAEVRPKVVAAHSRDEVRRLIGEMIERLHVSHMAIVPRYHPNLRESLKGDGVVGLDVRALHGAIVVYSVEAWGPAARAKVHAGWIVEAIGGRSIDELLAPVRKAYAGRSELPAYEALTVKGALIGPIDASVKVRFRDGDDHPVEVGLEHDQVRGELVKFGNFGPLPVEYVSFRQGGVMYVRLSAFFDPPGVMKRFVDDVVGAPRPRGLVLDLRGNTGGLVTMATGIAGHLVRHELVFGTSHARDSEQPLTAYPQADPFDGPVAVLVDELSASTTEILADALQASHRARVFGRRTMGAALPSTVVILPNGDLFQYPIADYVSAAGRRLDGNGVLPDEPFDLDRTALLAGRDDDLDAARRWIDRQAPPESTP